MLLVNDEAVIRTTVSMLLRLEGFSVASAAGGRAALQCALDNPPDVILADFNKPQMGGYKAIVVALLLNLCRQHAGQPDRDACGAGAEREGRAGQPDAQNQWRRAYERGVCAGASGGRPGAGGSSRNESAAKKRGLLTGMAMDAAAGSSGAAQRHRDRSPLRISGSIRL